LFPGKPGTPAPLFGVPVVCAKAAGPPITALRKSSAASVEILFMIASNARPAPQSTPASSLRSGHYEASRLTSMMRKRNDAKMVSFSEQAMAAP
jgi:hypothetical protein